MDQFLDTLRRVMERLWSPVVDFWDDVRRRQACPVDPSRPLPTADESDQATVVAIAQLQQMLVPERLPTITMRPQFIPWRWLPRRADRIHVTPAGPASLLEDDGDTTVSSAGFDATVAPAATETASP